MRKPNPAAGKQRLVIISPYPPAKSGIADYVAELMPYLLREFDVTLVIADDAPLPAEPAPRTLLASEFLRHRHLFGSVPKLYHFGNNAQHSYMLPLIRAEPGIVVLHDFNLGYLHEMDTARWNDRDRQLALMEEEYGNLGGEILQWQVKNEFREIFTGYELPLNGSVLESATAVVTHSRQVQYKTAARVPQVPVWHVPHLLSPLVSSKLPSRATARARLGLPRNEILITALGFVTRAKQIPLTLKALHNIRSRVPPFRFVLAGERRPHEYDVDADIAQSGMKSATICTDYLDPRQFFDLLAATDIVVNLRYPSSGEMSGTLVRALGMGLPTIVLDYGPIGELPDEAVRKITWDDRVETSLTRALRDLVTDAQARKALGARAAGYARAVHDIAHIAELYARIVRSTASRLRAGEHSHVRQFDASRRFVAKKLCALKEEAGTLVRTTDGFLWWRAAPISIGQQDEAALVLSADAGETAKLLSLLFEWNPAAITAMTPETFLAPDVRTIGGGPMFARTFSFALAIVPSDFAEDKAALLMRRLNAALRPGARLVLEVSASGGKVTPEAALGEPRLQGRLRDAGFGLVYRVTQSDGILSELVIPPDDEPDARFACVTGLKLGDYAVWRYCVCTDGLPQRWGGRTAVARMERNPS